MTSLILFPFSATRRGGSYVSGCLLAKSLDTAGLSVAAVFPERRGAALDFEGAGVSIEYLASGTLSRENSQARNLLNFVRTTIGALRILMNRRADIVHVNDDRTFLPWAIAARLCRTPVVWHVRDGRTGRLDFARALLANFIIFISHFAEQRIPQTGNSKIVYNAVDLNKFRPSSNRADCRARMGIGEGEFIMLHVGRDEPYKRLEWSVEALKACLAQGINSRLIVLGDVSERRRQEFHDRIESRDRDRLVFGGWVLDILEYLQSADLLIHPAQNETFGRVFVEAAACALPAVATNTGAANEVIADGKSGVVVDSDDPEVFCLACVSLASDSERRELLRGGALEVAIAFSAERHVAEILTIYHDLLPDKPTSRTEKRGHIKTILHGLQR